MTTKFDELNDAEIVELLKHDPESERLMGRLEIVLEDLREIAGKSNGDRDRGEAEVEIVSGTVEKPSD